jgi:hypothetical protein
MDGFLSSTDSLGPGPRRNRHPGPITRPQTLTTSITSPRRHGSPPPATSFPPAVHGSPRPAVTLGIATPIRPGPRARTRTRMASEPAQATSLRPGPAPRGNRSDSDDNANTARCHNTEECQLWTSRRTLWQVRGTSRRSNHVNLTYYARARRLHGRPTSQRGKVSLFGSARRLHIAPTLFGM